MTPMNHMPILQRHCYKVDPSGDIAFETKETSTRFFANSGLIHTVISQGEKPKEFLSEWSREVSETNADMPRCYYQLRLVSWIQRAWYILSLDHYAIISLAIVAEEHGYILSDREFSQVKPDGYFELFPFYSPTFRTLRPMLTRYK